MFGTRPGFKKVNGNMTKPSNYTVSTDVTMSQTVQDTPL